MTNRQLPVLCLLAAATALGGCGSAVQFERALGSGRYPAMPGNAAIAMAADLAALPQPVAVLGELRLAATKGSTPQGRAEEQLLDVAGRYGCDAIAEVREDRVDAFGKKTGNADTDMEYQWVAKCVRTAKAEAVALAASPRPKVAPVHRPTVNTAEIEQRKLAAEAEKARKDAERLAALAAEKEKQAKAAAEAADKERIRIEKAERARLEADRKRREADEEQRRREAEQAERDRKRKEAEAEERAKKEAEERARKEAEAAEKDLRRKEAEIEKARKELEEKSRKYAELTEGERKRKEAIAAKARKDAEEKARKEAEAAAERDRKKREVEAQKLAKLDAKKSADQAKKDEQAKQAAEAKAKVEAEAKAKREVEDRLRRDAEDKARKESEERARKDAEERSRKEADEKARRDAEDRTRKEAEDKARQQAEERARKEAEDKARQQAESSARKPAKGGRDAKVVDWKARFDAANADDSESAWLELLGGMPDGEDNDRAFERLQRSFRARAGTWLSLDAAKVTPDEVEAAAVGDPAQLKRELAEAGATMSRFLVPREYSQVWTLRNPTKHPVVVDVRGPSGRIVRQLDAGATASGTLKAACPPLGPPLRSKVGLVLEYRFGCDVAKNVPKLGAVRPIRRELAIDRKAGDPDPGLEAIARLWSANPGTRLADVHLWAIDEAMRRRGDELAQIAGKVHVGERTSAGGQAVKVELRNNSARDLTIVFEVGTGRDERLTVAHKSSESIRLELPPGKSPDLHIKATVPKLRSPDWLVGLWSFQGLLLVILPGPSGLQAWAVEPAAGDDATPKLHAFAVRQTGADVTLEAEPPGLVALALFADKTPAACDKRCAIAVKIKLSDQDRFIAGAGRVLLALVEIPGKTGTFEFNADN